jgi:hypothetical protein
VVDSRLKVVTLVKGMSCGMYRESMGDRNLSTFWKVQNDSDCKLFQQWMGRMEREEMFEDFGERPFILQKISAKMKKTSCVT